jgi:hypothetical protein
MTKALLEKIREFEVKAGKDWMKEFEGLKTTEEIVGKVSSFDIAFDQELAEEALKLIQAGAEDLTEEELAALAGGKIVIH